MEEKDAETEKSLQDIVIPNVVLLGNVKPAHENGTVNPKCKRKKPISELEALGVTDIKEDFDVYTNDTDHIYKKYKLRNISKKHDYKNPSYKNLPVLLYTKIKPKKKDCENCDQVFQTPRKLHAHMTRAHNDFKCSQCLLKFETNKELVSHKSVHETENKTYLCQACKLAFSNYCDYLVHGLIHENSSNKFVCPECGVITLSRLTIQNHVRSHFYTTCPVCDIEVPGGDTLEEHVCKNSHNIECVECGNFFSNEMRYEEHMALHTGVKIHQCLYCGKGFYENSQKEIHMQTHQ